MPELPEVETIARRLHSKLAGKSFRSVHVCNPAVLRFDPELLTAHLVHKKIRRVWRRAKLLIIELDPDQNLVFHLKMTGRVILSDVEDKQGEKAHICFEVEDGTLMYFLDQRKFGYCALVSHSGLEQWDFYANLGPEPLEINQQEFVDLFLNRKARIKALLLDQKTIAGIGNIYADESLFAAGILPNEPACSIGEKRLARLYTALCDILAKAMQAGGSSFRDYVDASGKSGSFQEQFAVYGRGKQACPCCTTPLDTVKVAGRTSTYCPNCQKDDR